MVEVMVLKPTCLFAWDNPTGQQLSGAVYLSLGLACCGPAGKGLLESMPDLCLPDLLVLTEGLGQRSPPSQARGWGSVARRADGRGWHTRDTSGVEALA